MAAAALHLIERALVDHCLVRIQCLLVVPVVEGRVGEPQTLLFVLLPLLLRQRLPRALHPVESRRTLAPARRVLGVMKHLPVKLDQGDGARVVARLQKCVQLGGFPPLLLLLVSSEVRHGPHPHLDQDGR
eukprot:scaffold3321_cov90-Isochrysis_galbana.AAC.3